MKKYEAFQKDTRGWLVHLYFKDEINRCGKHSSLIAINSS